ncbi:hypothetical protein LSAT2_028641 [Lamellibrachia satsuma]|nr:hypothetical protein LSAT2_028641 [Lamellibrachia satsuma]
MCLQESELEVFSRLIAKEWLEPKLNEIIDEGVPLPHFKYVRYVNPDVRIVKGALLLGVDFKYDSSLVD